jgi:phage terminase small subunit
MGGRPPKPTRLHILQGTGRPHRLRQRGREPIPSGTVGGPPSWLWPEAQQIWKEVVVAYGGAAVLTPADRTTLALFCQGLAHWREAGRSGKPLPVAFIAVIMRIGGKLGLNPTDRARLHVNDSGAAGTRLSGRSSLLLGG